MVSVPAFLLRRLYVKGSLRNLQNGWEFQLKNGLGSGYARGMLPLEFDGSAVPLESSFFTTEDTTEAIAFADVNDQKTFGLKMGKVVAITVKGTPLAEGAHTVAMGFIVPGLGKLRFDFSDVVASGSV